MLRHVGDARRRAALLARRRGHCARIGLLQADEDARQGRLARAGRADDDHRFARLHLQVHARQHRLPAQALVHAVRGQHGDDAAAQAGHARGVERRRLLGAAGDALAAAAGEGAAARALFMRARDALQVLAVLARPGAQQPARVGMARRRQHRCGRPRFHGAAAVQHQHVAIERTRQFQVVRHHHQLALRRFGAQAPEHQRAGVRVKRGRRLVQHQQLRRRRQRRRQQDALQLAAAALGRIAQVQIFGQAQREQQVARRLFGRPAPHAQMPPQRRRHLRQYGVLGIEGVVHVLRHQARMAAAPAPQRRVVRIHQMHGAGAQAAADPPRRHAEQGARQCALAGARFADDHQRHTRSRLEVQVAQQLAAIGLDAESGRR